uniref:Uncharacterized protein n=1 Tax=Sphaerodactylus townsendi TaxID=933632 RepID=A0ACB8EZZ0_9SAUR
MLKLKAAAFREVILAMRRTNLWDKRGRDLGEAEDQRSLEGGWVWRREENLLQDLEGLTVVAMECRQVKKLNFTFRIIKLTNLWFTAQHQETNCNKVQEAKCASKGFALGHNYF